VNRSLPISFISIALLVFMVSAPYAWEPVDSLTVERLWFYENGDSAAIPYSSTHNLHQQHSQITRAIINIHGASREAEIAMANVRTGGNQHDRPVWDDTAVICPQFLFTLDLDYYTEITDTLLYWHNIWDIGPTWCFGEQSDNDEERPRTISRSSYACLDTLAEVILDAFPNLQNLVFAGHSAGARMTQRYTLVTRWDHNLNSPRILYNFANPAIYAYIGPERYVDENWDEFAIPPQNEIDECPEYDSWPFGLQDPYDYFFDITPEEVLENYANRYVIQWLSEFDTTAMDGGSQVSCQAMLSGDQHRLQRGLIFYNHMQYTYNGEPEHFIQAIVPNLGHQGNPVYRSAVGRYFLFDHYHPITPGEEVDLAGELTVPIPSTIDGIIEYSLTVNNLGNEFRTGHVWMQLVSNVDGSTVTGWTRSVVFEPEMDFSRTGMHFYVPHGFPHGEATFYLNVGSFPDAIATFDTVPVIVSSTTSVTEFDGTLPPSKPSIISVAPNPFNAMTTVAFDIPRPTALRLAVYDILGREVAIVANGAVQAGRRSYLVNGQQLAGGIYFLHASAPGGYEEVRKILLVP
jgi:hypothetical protein